MGLPSPRSVPSNCQAGHNPAAAESVESSFRPTYVATDPAGDVLVVNYYGIQKFSDSGALITAWGVPGAEPGQPGSPYGLATDPEGNVYVADYAGHRIQKFSPG